MTSTKKTLQQLITESGKDVVERIYCRILSPCAMQELMEMSDYSGGCKAYRYGSFYDILPTLLSVNTPLCAYEWNQTPIGESVLTVWYTQPE